MDKLTRGQRRCALEALVKFGYWVTAVEIGPKEEFLEVVANLKWEKKDIESLYDALRFLAMLLGWVTTAEQQPQEKQPAQESTAAAAAAPVKKIHWTKDPKNKGKLAKASQKAWGTRRLGLIESSKFPLVRRP